MAKFRQIDSGGLAEAVVIAKVCQGVGREYFRLAVIVAVLNAVSSILFIYLCNRPVYDDPNNLPDVHRYATQGVSLETIRQHINPTGPGSFIWMAGTVRLFGGNELRSARLGALLSWLFLGVGTLIGARFSRSPQLWYAVLIVVLVCPHTLTASATLLTEGPALLFAIVGLAAWLQSMSQPLLRPYPILLGLVGGLSIGMAIVSRQYYLALMPATVIAALLQFRSSSTEKKRAAYAVLAASLLGVLIPLGALIWTWKGLASPAMVLGASYGNWSAKIGLNVFRPLVAAFYLAFYLVPLTLPAMPWRPISWGFSASVLGGMVIGWFHSSLLQPGPLHSFVLFVARTPSKQFLVLSLIGALTIHNALALGAILWEQRREILSSLPVRIGLFTILFFVAEQIGIGGNMPFYERYVLQVAPFLGLVSCAALPKWTSLRLFTILMLSLLSHGLLWRFAFGAY